MKTRLLGAAVLIALAVIFVPMFFSSKPPVAGGDQSVSLAIPPAPDGELQTRTMSLDPNAPVSAASAAGTAVAGVNAVAGQLATVDIKSRRPGDVGTDAAGGRAGGVQTGTGSSPAQPVIPMQNQPDATAPAAVKPVAERPATPARTAAPPVEPRPSAPRAVTDKTPDTAVSAPVAGRGSYTLNLSAYASASGAARLESRVRALGYPVRGHVITQAGKQRTLVIAGPFETRTAAEAARLKITQSIPGAPAHLQQNAQDEAATPSRAVASGASRPGGYAVQVAAVSSQADANALRDKLRANGFAGFVDSVESSGKRLWRVRAGPFTQRAEAQHVQDVIKAKLRLNGNVVSVP